MSLQDVIAKGKGPGYELWAKKYNVKNVMKAILFFQEQGLRTYEELAEKAESSASRYYKYKLMKKSERIELLEWLRSRPLSTKVEVNETTFVLTHSFFKVDKFDVPYSEIDYQTAWDIVWDSYGSIIQEIIQAYILKNVGTAFILLGLCHYIT